MENGGGETVALPSDRAAVDRVVGACDVRRPVRSDEGRELRELLGLSEALEKRLFGYRVPGGLVVAEVAVAGRGQERPRTNRHRTDPIACAFKR